MSDNHAPGLFRRVASAFAAMRPPRRWNLAVLLAAGVLGGLFLAVLQISRATSYLSNDPRACINCHIMRPEYIAWERGSHGRVATCNDCHVPHDNVLRKYFFKAKDGTRHASMFMLRLEPQTIRMHEAGQQVVMENCLRCHGNFFPASSQEGKPADARELKRGVALHGEGRLCWDCHRETPHGRVHSLSSTPDGVAPGLGSPLPEWMERAREQMGKGETP